MARSTRADVARMAGVAPSTVSLILNGHSKELKIAEDTIKRVQEAAAELRYVPQASARALRKQSTRVVGVFMEQVVDDPFIPAVHHVLVQALISARARGYLIVPLMEPKDDPIAIAAALGNVDLAGAVCETPFSGKGRESHYLSSILESLDVPTTWMSAVRDTEPLAGIGHVRIIESEGFAEMWDEIEHSGRVAIYTGPNTPDSRFEIIRERASGPVELFESANWKAESITEGARSIIANLGDISELWCGVDAHAVALLVAARQAGIRVPEDLQIIGYGDFPVAVEHGLSTVRWPLKEMTDLAMTHVIDAIEDGTLTKSAMEVMELPTLARPRTTTRNLTAP